ncbi:MAG: BrnT family toxin [Deltaproteobacteria bacterium]|nr:BrnT family toxin [Deltaproteobacteria bacterium]
MKDYIFEWNLHKEELNKRKHGIGFETAIQVFFDPNVVHLEDENHSSEEERFFAVGKCFEGKVLTVRYTTRGNVIRIFGAANWRKWRKFYEKNT